jgi:predicted dehydrogenase
MSRGLRAVVIGAGWAGTGHTVALRHYGVDVVAICARQEEAVRTAAENFGVMEASTNWQETLQRVRPEIVSIATPAALRSEPLRAAVELGAHVLCDKPLAISGADAGSLYRIVERAGVKHAYAATHHYDPSIAWVGELIREGAIGTLREIMGTFRMDSPRAGRWGWQSTLASGGGILNNGLTHALAMYETASGGRVTRAMGEARVLNDRAPVVPYAYGPNGRPKPKELTAEEQAQVEWRPRDADDAFTALLRLQTDRSEVHATFAFNRGIATPGRPDRLVFYGDDGTLVAEGILIRQPSVFRAVADASEMEPLPVPQRLLDALPQVGDDVQNKWCALARDFVADIRGEPHRPYLTFHDGWRYQIAIDAIRAGNWQAVPD